MKLLDECRAVRKPLSEAGRLDQDRMNENLSRVLSVVKVVPTFVSRRGHGCLILDLHDRYRLH